MAGKEWEVKVSKARPCCLLPGASPHVVEGGGTFEPLREMPIWLQSVLRTLIQR